MGSKSKTPPIQKPRLSEELLERYLMLGALLFFLAIAVYIPVMNGGYIYDDDQLLWRNQTIQRGGRQFFNWDALKNEEDSKKGDDSKKGVASKTFINWESLQGLKTIWYPKEQADSADYFPVTSTSLWIEWRFWGDNQKGITAPENMGIGAPAYHVSNIVLHAACAVLLWMVFFRLGLPGAWFIALIWAVHPVCAESVAWISERKNTLSMLFFLWGMFAWLKFQKERQTKDYIICFVLILIAMLAKTAIVMVPFIMLLHVWWERGWQVKLDWREVVHFICAQLVIVLACELLREFVAAWRMGGVYFSLGGQKMGGIVALIFITLLVLPLLGIMMKKFYGQLAPMWREMVDFEGALAIFVVWCAIGFVFWGGTWIALAIFALLVTPAMGFLMYLVSQRLSPVWRQVLPFFALSFVLGIVTIIFQYNRAIADEVIPMGTPLERIAGASFALGFYIYKLFIPLHLSLIYPQWHKIPPHALESLSPGSMGNISPEKIHMGLPYIALLCIPAVLYAVVFIWAWMRRATWGRHVIFSVGFFVINLAPILGLMKIAYLRLTLVADHFQYTAMISIIALVVAGLARIWHTDPKLRPLLATVACGFTLVFGTFTWLRAEVFAEPEHVWKDTLERYPDSWQAHSHMGALLYGKFRYDEAYEHWQRCVELVPYLYEVHNNLGLVLSVKGRIPEALAQYKMAVDIKGDYPMLRMNYANALIGAKLYEDALKQYRILIKQIPNGALFYCQMGVVYYQMGKLDEALRCFNDAIKIEPNYIDARHNLEVVRQQKIQELEKPAPEPQKQVPETPSPAPSGSTSAPNNAKPR